MLIEAQDLESVAIGEVDVAADDQIVLVVSSARLAAEVVAAAKDRRVVGSEVCDDRLGMDQKIAALSAQAFFDPAFEALIQQQRSLLLLTIIRMP